MVAFARSSNGDAVFEVVEEGEVAAGGGGGGTVVIMSVSGIPYTGSFGPDHGIFELMFDSDVARP